MIDKIQYVLNVYTTITIVVYIAIVVYYICFAKDSPLRGYDSIPDWDS